MTLPVHNGRAFGRHVDHDPRSVACAYRVAAVKPQTVLWTHNAPVLDQGQLGSCTGNALAQWFNTDFAQSRLLGTERFVRTETDAVALYSAATHLDRVPGVYPPTDTGSSGLAVCKAAHKAGALSSYGHAFGLDALLLTLQHTPVIVGTSWAEGMFTPDAAGQLHLTGKNVGGHEYLILGCDVLRGRITMLNSWSDSWGQDGRAWISFADFSHLLSMQGDVTVPVI